MAISKLEAIKSLHPTAEFSIRDGLVTWVSEDIDEPTEAEITAEQERLQTEYDNNEYQRSRAAEYPSVIDQLDDIYHNGIDGWKATIKETKDKYPKE